jgi:hypothetical protein
MSKPKLILAAPGIAAPNTGEMIIPGSIQPPPFIVPYCGFCELPAERYVIEPPKECYRIAVDAECCGHHQGAYVTLEEVRRLKRTGDKLMMVVRKGAFRGVRGVMRRMRSDTGATK